MTKNNDSLHLFTVSNQIVKSANVSKSIEIVVDENNNLDKMFSDITSKYRNVYKDFSIYYYGKLQVNEILELGNKPSANKIRKEKRETLKNFVCKLQYSLDLFSSKLTAAEKRSITKIINKLKK
jgi:hypothetical protein